MFNFNELIIVQPNEPQRYRGSFVGIRKDKYLNKMVFTLPKGFDDFKENYDSIKNLFFSMYRTFEKFRKNSEKYLDNHQNNKDNIQITNHQGVYTFTDEDGNDTILYSKIDIIDNIFKTYQELEIESLIQELGLIEEVDYSKIENYLDKGIYLNNHAIFIEHMVGYRNIVRGVPSELIEIFCYIYKELADELEKEVSSQIKEIAFNFSYKYLSPEQSLFDEHSFESTISILKDCLDNIHKTTAYKNYQYWDIYEAVEHFLYGSLEFDKDSEQGFWGINNFSYIWEEMCNVMILKDKTKKVLYCDSNLPADEYKENLTAYQKYQGRFWVDRNEIDNNFNLTFHSFKRNIYPDIIIRFDNENFKIGDNPLKVAIARRILSIKQERVKSILSFEVNRLNVDIVFNKNTQDSSSSNLMKISEQIFELFSERFANLHRTKGIRQGSLQGYQHLKKSKYAISLKNIPKDKFEEVYQDILGRGEKNQTIDDVFVIDWKYYSHSIFDNKFYRNDDRVNTSIIKQLAYEFCLSQSISKPITSQFGVPCYNEDSDDIIIKNGCKMLDCGIELVKLNFQVIQEMYLKDE